MTPRPEADVLARRLMRDGRLAAGSNPRQNAELEKASAEDVEKALRAAELAVAERCKAALPFCGSECCDKLDPIIHELRSRS